MTICYKWDIFKSELNSETEKRKKALYKYEKKRFTGHETGKFAIDHECNFRKGNGFPYRIIRDHRAFTEYGFISDIGINRKRLDRGKWCDHIHRRQKKDRIIGE